MANKKRKPLFLSEMMLLLKVCVLFLVVYSCSHPIKTLQKVDELTRLLNEIKLVDSVLGSSPVPNTKRYYKFTDTSGESKMDNPTLLKKYPAILNDFVVSYEGFIDQDTLGIKLKQLVKKKPVAYAYYLLSRLDDAKGISDNTKNIDKAIALDNQIGKYFLERASIYSVKNYGRSVADFYQALKLNCDTITVYKGLIDINNETKNQAKVFAYHKKIEMILLNRLRLSNSSQLESAKRDLALSEIAEAYDYLRFNKPDSAKNTVEKAITHGYELKAEDKFAFKL